MLLFGEWKEDESIGRRQAAWIQWTVFEMDNREPGFNGRMADGSRRRMHQKAVPGPSSRRELPFCHLVCEFSAGQRPEHDAAVAGDAVECEAGAGLGLRPAYRPHRLRVLPRAHRRALQGLPRLQDIRPAGTPGSAAPQPHTALDAGSLGCLVCLQVSRPCEGWLMRHKA
jgi:hypothetical protein